MLDGLGLSVLVTSHLAPGGRRGLDVRVRPALAVPGVWRPASATIKSQYHQVPDLELDNSSHTFRVTVYFSQTIGGFYKGGIVSFLWEVQVRACL